MSVSPARALYSTLRYWRSSGLHHIEIPKIDEASPDAKELLELKNEKLQKLNDKTSTCQLCPLSKGRERIVFGQGNANARLIFIIGHLLEKDESENRPLTGEAGELFDRMLQKMNMTREQIYLTTLVKCKTANHKEPEKNEIEACSPILQEQIGLIAPSAICTMGSLATNALLDLDLPIAKARGRQIHWNQTIVFPTFHPAYLIKKKAARKEVWKDMLAILSFLKKSHSEESNATIKS